MAPTYPYWVYHKELARDGKLVRSEADEPKGDGWVDTPAAFEEGYVKPEPQVNEAGQPKSAPVPGHVHVSYPSWRYNKAGEEKQVLNAEEDHALDASVWKDTLAAFNEVTDAPPDTAPPVPDSTGNTARPPSTPPPTGPSRAAVQKAEFYDAKVKDIAEKVATGTDVETLQMIHGFELKNPAGARPGVIKAVEKRLSELAPAPE